MQLKIKIKSAIVKNNVPLSPYSIGQKSTLMPVAVNSAQVNAYKWLQKLMLRYLIDYSGKKNAQIYTRGK